MKKIKVNLKGGVLGRDDTIEYDGHEMPGIYRIDISAGVHEAPTINVHAYCATTEMEFGLDRVTITALKVGGATVQDYESLIAERDVLRERCRILEKG